MAVHHYFYDDAMLGSPGGSRRSHIIQAFTPSSSSSIANDDHDHGKKKNREYASVPSFSLLSPYSLRWRRGTSGGGGRICSRRRKRTRRGSRVERRRRRIQFLTTIVVVTLSASAPPQPPEGIPYCVRPAPIVPVEERQGRLLRIVIVANAQPAGC